MTFWRPPVAIAHRGSRLLWPENTTEAFSAAVDLGISHIETDLRMTSDGVLVCFHDPTVDRTTEGTGPVSGLTWDELAALDAGHRHGAEREFPYRGAGVKVPRFEELISDFPGLGVIAELKADGLAEPLVRLIEDHDLHDRIIVGSFSDKRLAEVRELSRGRVRTSTGMAATRRWVLAARAGRPVMGGATALQVPVQSRGLRVVNQRLIRIAHEAGLDVHVWTVNEESEMVRLLDLGVDGLITDRPDLLRRVLTERGEWQ